MHPAAEKLLTDLRGAWVYRWIALSVAWVLALLGWAAILVLPDRYLAVTRVYVDTQTAMANATKGITLDSGVEIEVNRMREAILGGPILERVAEEAGVLAAAKTPRERQMLLDDVRKKVEVSGHLGGASSTAGVYTLSFTNGDRAKALAVVEGLRKAFAEGSIGGSRNENDQAQKFLAAQIAEYDKRLTEAETRLADFKKTNVGLMPGAQGDYFSHLRAEMDGLAAARNSYNVALQRKGELTRQLRGEEPLLPAASTNTVPSIVASTDTATRLRQARDRLEELLLRFTDKHPDVVATRETIRDLEQRQQEEIDAARQGDHGAASRSGLSVNPIYQNAQLQLNQVSVDIAALAADIAERERRVANLRALVNTAPEVEAEYARLNRDYDVTKSKYQALVDRLERAKLGDDADEEGVARFDTIEPPTASHSPVFPNRPLFSVIVLFLALGGGAAAGYGLYLLKPTYSSAKQVAHGTGRQVLGVISGMWSADRDEKVRRNTLLFGGGVCSLIVVAGGVFLLIDRISMTFRSMIT